MEKPLALIIEDDRDIAALFRHVLDIAGYHTEIVLHGNQAVKRLEATRPDVVLLDLHLPGIPGEKILEKMHSDPQLKTVPVVVVTAFAEDANSLPVEPDLILLKPVDLEQLSILVQRLQATYSSVQNSPWDTTSHVYNRSFFVLRLNYSLERLRKLGSGRFSVLFVDLEPLASLRNGTGDRQINIFLQQTATRLKTVLRPTDTTGHFGGGFFMILIEEVGNSDIPVRIAARVQVELGNYLSEVKYSNGMRAYVGVVLCDTGYGSAEEILSDVELARQLARENKDYVLYDRETLMGYRPSLQNS